MTEFEKANYRVFHHLTDFLRFVLGSLNHAWEFLPLAALQRCGGKEEEEVTTSHRDAWGGKKGFQGALGMQMGIMDPLAAL